MADMGEAAYRGHVVVNCRTDTRGIADDVVNISRQHGNKAHLYKPLASDKGRIVKKGEIFAVPKKQFDFCGFISNDVAFHRLLWLSA